MIIQDTRGRFDSQGEFYPFRYESQDGYDTVEWAAKLPYANGKVGMFGGSYVGATQMLAAISSPPHLVAIQPYVTASEYYDGWTYQNGALMQWFASSWSSGLAVDTLRRKAAGLEDPKSWVTQLPVESYRMLELPPVSALAPYFRDWVAHERDDDYWRPWKISDHYAEMNIKALHAGGWHDIFLKGTIQNYVGMRQRFAGARRSAAAAGSVGARRHFARRQDRRRHFRQERGAGYRRHHPALVRLRAEGRAQRVRHGRAGAPLHHGRKRVARRAGVSAGAHEVHELLPAQGRASTDAPGAEEPEQPTNTTRRTRCPPSAAGLCCGNNQLPPGPADQRPNEGRAGRAGLLHAAAGEGRGGDRLGQGHPLRRRVRRSTPISRRCWRMWSLPATRASSPTASCARAIAIRRRRPEPIEPGKIYEYTIDLWATSNVFKAGHRIRLYVSSSNFPRFNRNLNTGEPIAGSTRHGEGRASGFTTTRSIRRRWCCL